MKLNRLEYALMSNPLRGVVQKRVEARRLLRMGGAVEGQHAFEMGCGRGIGMETILDLFRAHRVDGFDLDAVRG